MDASEHRKEKRRSRSPDNQHRRERRHRSRSPKYKHVLLPFSAHALHKYDLSNYRATFALYLDVQKQIDIESLSTDEIKGRWKSFLGKWNRRELAEGWYDPSTKRKADAAALDVASVARISEDVAQPRLPAGPRAEAEKESEEEDDYGPSLPGRKAYKMSAGPGVPSLQDIQHRNEEIREKEEAQRDDLRYARSQDRRAQKDHLDEIVPRAEPGTRERQLEKKREVAAVNRSFRDAKSPGAEDVGEADAMGDDGVEAYKAQLRASEKKKSERELRKEEILRARAVEREERLAEHRAKEDKTMDMLKALAKQRYG